MGQFAKTTKRNMKLLSLTVCVLLIAAVSCTHNKERREKNKERKEKKGRKEKKNDNGGNQNNGGGCGIKYYTVQETEYQTSSSSRSQASLSALTRSERCAVLSLVTNKSATRITDNRAAASPLVPPKWWRAVLQSNRLLTDRSATRVHRRCATRSHRRCATRSHQRPVASNQ